MKPKNELLWVLTPMAALAVCLGLSSCVFNSRITVPRYALVYGVQNYINNISPLHYTINDATVISQTLANSNWTIKALGTDNNTPGATRAEIVAGIANLAATAEPDSTVLFYFSGHGDLSNDGSTALIAPWDTDFQRDAGGAIIYVNNVAQINMSTVITAPQLASMLAALPTKNIIVILDCCFSGVFASSGSSIDASPPNYQYMPNFSAFSTALVNFGDLLSANASASGAKAPIVIAAAGSQEFSYDGTPAMNHGVFTYFLLQAAVSGDTNGDGYVTTTEAFTYTQKAIMAWDPPYLGNTDPNVPYPFLPHISGGVRDLVLFGH